MSQPSTPAYHPNSDTEPSERDKMFTALGKLIAGLQVPLSLNGPVFLGAGYDPMHEILEMFVSWGWRTPEDCEADLRRILDGPSS